MSTRFALLVGVSDYTTFDASAHNPPGASNLFGPAANLAAMWDFCRSLGYSAGDVGHLASPLAPPVGGHPAYYAAATRDAILAGVRLLADRLAGAEASQGLIYFSGHGDYVDGVGPVLCPADTAVDATGDLVRVVSLVEIGAILTERAPGRAVTIVLDSCESGMPEQLVNRSLGRLRAAASLRDGDTLVSATGPGQVGAELLVDGAWRGALTWALCAAASPYRRVRAGDFLVPDLSVGAWVERARALLRGMSVDQNPRVYGDTAAAVLAPTGTPPVVPAGELADPRRGHVEIWGDEAGRITGDEPVWTQFALQSTNGTVIGKFVESFATSPGTLAPYSDFWAWNAGHFFPDVFRMDYTSMGTQGVNSPPTGLPAAVPMWAFAANLTQFGQFDPSGWTVWAITTSSSTNNPLGYLVRNSNGAIRWIVTALGYSQRGLLFADLPSPQNNGGVLLNDNSGLLWFTRITPSGNLAQTAPSYDVKAASGN